jgi:hypothetical protein
VTQGLNRRSAYDSKRGGTGETTAGSSRTTSGSAAGMGTARRAHALGRGAGSAGSADSAVPRRACCLGRSAA